MRIIAGKLRGSTIYITKNKRTRPLKDMVRESIFNLLIHSKKILFQFENSHVLDLYAGTGSFGLECLSRNVESVYFVEELKEAINILKKNIEKLKTRNKAIILTGDVIALLEKKETFVTQFNLIFCDPPFKDAKIKKLIELIYSRNLLKKNGIIILHRNKFTEEKFPKYLKILEERNYGISKIIFARILV